MFRNTFTSETDVTSARLVRGGVLVGSSTGVRYHRTLPVFTASAAASRGGAAPDVPVYQLHVPTTSSSSASSAVAAVTQYEGIVGTTTTAMAAKSALTHVVGGTDNGSVRVWDGATEAQVRTFANCHRAAVTAVEYHPFGEFLATGSRDTHVRVWDFRKKSCLQAYKTAGAGAVEALRFSPDGRWVASGDANGTVRIFDLVKGELMRELPMAAVGGAAAGAGSSGSAISTIVSSLAFHPLRCEIAVASAGGSLSVWDCLTFQPLFTTAQPGCTVAGFVNAACLAFTGSHSRHVHVYAQGGSHHEALERVAPAVASSSGVSLESAFQLRDLRGGTLGESSANAPDSAAAVGADPGHALVPLNRPLLQLAYTTARSVVLTQLAVPARFSDGNGAVAASRPTSRTASRPPSASAATVAGGGINPAGATAAAAAAAPPSPVPAPSHAAGGGGTSPLPPAGGILHGRRSGQSSAAASAALDRPSSAQPSPIPGSDPLQAHHQHASRAQTADSGVARPHLSGAHGASGGTAGDLSARGGAAARPFAAQHHPSPVNAGSNSSTPTSTPATAPASVVAAAPGTHIPAPKLVSGGAVIAAAAGRPPTPPPAPIHVAASPLPASAPTPPFATAAAAATADDDDAALLAQTIGRSDTMVHRMTRRQSDLAIFRSFWPQQPDRAFAHLEQVILETKDCAVAVSFLSNLHRPRIKGQVSWEHAPALLGLVATILQSYGVDAFLIAAIKAARHLNQRFRVRLEEGARGINGPTPGRIPPVGAVEKCRLALSRLAEIQPIVAELCLKSGALGVEAKSLIADLPVPGSAAAGSGGSMGF